MPVTVYKLINCWGRVHYYECELTFRRRMTTLAVKEHFERQRWAKDSFMIGRMKSTRGFHLVNGEWQEYPLDVNAVTKSIFKKEEREQKRRARFRQLA